MPIAARILAYDDTNQSSECCLMIEQDPRSRCLVPRALGVGKMCIPDHPIPRAIASGWYLEQRIPAPTAAGS
jgi:hypothetical protein